MKNIILIIFLLFINSCGYTSVYKNFKGSDLQLIIVDEEGDRDMNSLIRNEINLYSNINSINKFKITIKTMFEKSILTKDSGGLITDYKLTVNSTFKIFFDQKSKEITLSEQFNIKNKADTFEQETYERSIKRNFASSLRDKLIAEILTLK